jgi:hypothetical protein
VKRDFSFCGAFIADIFSFFVGSMFEILRGHFYKPLRGRVELLGEHCGQSQQSRMELGLRVSRGLSRASCDSIRARSSCHPAITNDSTAILRFSEIARVLVRLDHVASFIVNANHCIMSAEEKLTAFLELESAIRRSPSVDQ